MNEAVIEYTYVKDIFEENNLSPAPDYELTSLVIEASKYLKKEELVKFLKAEEKFNKQPVHVVNDDWSDEKIVHWHGLRKSLELIPSYFQAAEKVGFDYEETNQFLFHLIESIKYDFVQEYEYISGLEKVMNSAAENNLDLKQNKDIFKKMLSLAGENGVLPASLYAFTLTTKIGCSVEQSCEMIMKHPDADGALAGYTFPHFNRALKTLTIADVNPDLVVELFNELGGERPYFEISNYANFEQLITFGCPIHDKTPNEVLTALVAYARRKNKDTPLLNGYVKELEEKEQGVDRRFIKINGPLVVAALSYQNNRSLNEGLKDLEKIAVINPETEWEETGQAMWILDPEKNTWYSLGGKDDIQPGRIRRNFITYDVSKLSKTPVMFKVHPDYYAIMIVPNKRDLSYPILHKKVSAFYVSTPSRADFDVLATLMQDSSDSIQPKSYIVHSIGTTEVRFPKDISKLKAISETFRDLRDKVMLEFDVFQYVYEHGNRETSFEFVQKCYQKLNKCLPDGFELILHPPGFDLESHLKN